MRYIIIDSKFVAHIVLSVVIMSLVHLVWILKAGPIRNRNQVTLVLLSGGMYSCTQLLVLQQSSIHCSTSSAPAIMDKSPVSPSSSKTSSRKRTSTGAWRWRAGLRWCSLRHGLVRPPVAPARSPMEPICCLRATSLPCCCWRPRCRLPAPLHC
jgi:hypothetical protein